MEEAFYYSGRGMFGKRCMAFRSLEALLNAIREAPDLPADGWNWDSLGKGIVFYNPRVEAPEPNDENA